MYRVWLPLLCAALLSACASSGNDDAPTPRNPFRPSDETRLERLDVEQRYRNARASLESADYASALEQYDEILTKFPFTRFSTQAQLESVYAHYRSYAPDTALASVEQFIREHPRYSSIDYAYFLQGLINYSRSLGTLDNLLPIDSTKRDPIYARRAFSDFALLIQKFPNSDYAWDARQRMIYLRNRIAQHEIHVAEFYLRRKAYVAASRRAREIIEQYQQTDSIPRALEIMKASYIGMDLPGQAAKVDALIAANSTAFKQAKATKSDAPAVPSSKAETPPTALTITPVKQAPQEDQSSDATTTQSATETRAPRGPRKRR